MTIHSDKAIEKHVLKPCEKDDESISKGKKEVELEHCKEKIDFSLVLSSLHVMTNQRKVNHNSEKNLNFHTNKDQYTFIGCY
jgi:hypothetical protein